jgi:hypothetical protein
MTASTPRPAAVEPSTPSSAAVPPTPKESLSLINPTSLRNGATAPPPASPKVADKDPAVIVEGKGDDKPLQAPPAPVPPVGVEVVGFSGCCGRASHPAPNAPVELPPVVADPKMSSAPVAESKTPEDKLSVDTREDLSRPKDAAFNTPKDLATKKKPDTLAAPSFRPKVVESAVGAGGGALRREGLGLHHSDEETEGDESRGRAIKGQGQARLQNARQAVEEATPGNSRFHRRDEKSFDKEKKRNPLSDDEEEDDLGVQQANTRRK